MTHSANKDNFNLTQQYDISNIIDGISHARKMDVEATLCLP